ncbi:hypothetical protein KAR91_06080 [Candidatus Pacearchaeota archaeon]|nr:hypothetical protein [Candidatus Pacearchaeota archaeon]
MTFNDLHAMACNECGQSDLMLKQIRLNDANERARQEEFKQEKFENCLERAIAIYMPYFESGNVIHEKYANLYALCIANHRSENHAEDRTDEIEIYTIVVQTSFVDGDEMVERTARSWWAS